MNRIVLLIATLWNNPHTRWCAIVVIAAFALCNGGPIWLPAYRDQFAATQQLLDKGLLLWAVYLATCQSPSKEPNKEPTQTP